jgi:hypothetical protein
MLYDCNRVRQYTWKHIMTINGCITNKMYKAYQVTYFDATPLVYNHDNKRTYVFYKND